MRCPMCISLIEHGLDHWRQTNNLKNRQRRENLELFDTGNKQAALDVYGQPQRMEGVPLHSFLLYDSALPTRNMDGLSATWAWCCITNDGGTTGNTRGEATASMLEETTCCSEFTL